MPQRVTTHLTRYRRLLLLAAAVLLTAAAAWPAPPAATPTRYFKITILDEQTGRGVPLVELRTVSNVRYVTDSRGVVAFYEPGLMDRDVFFFVQSHGYEFATDGFGIRGTRLTITHGGSATLKIKRRNLAERLYRITGEGIYRDSVLVGDDVPIAQPLLNGQVAGQDSAYAVPYQGKLYWFWGDTARPSYPLGNFQMSGATSLLPGKGGLDPSLGVNLTYFVDKNGFSRPMAPLPQPGLVWLDGILVVPDATGRERMVAGYERLRGLGQTLARGLVQFNDATETFEPLGAPLDRKHPLYPRGHPFRHTVDGQAYFYFPHPYPALRVKATLADFTRPDRYEAFTCLAPGARWDGPDKTRLDRDAQGSLRWAWKADTEPLAPARQRELLAAGKMKPGESPFDLRDLDTGAPVEAHGGSVCWNAFRKRWVMIVVQAGGTSSYLGEVWYAEAPAPEGPWRDAKKIVTHDRYSFYNPVQHPVFDQAGGRIIYFEGTYTHTFSGTLEAATPRYDYNQVLYRLDLADERLRRKETAPVKDTQKKTP